MDALRSEIEALKPRPLPELSVDKSTSRLFKVPDVNLPAQSEEEAVKDHNNQGEIEIMENARKVF